MLKVPFSHADFLIVLNSFIIYELNLDRKLGTLQNAASLLGPFVGLCCFTRSKHVRNKKKINFEHVRLAAGAAELLRGLPWTDVSSAQVTELTTG